MADYAQLADSIKLHRANGEHRQRQRRVKIGCKSAQQGNLAFGRGGNNGSYARNQPRQISEQNETK